MGEFFCAVEGCVEYPTGEEVKLEFRIPGPEGTRETIQVVVPVCVAHQRQLEAWGAREAGPARAFGEQPAGAGR